MKHFEVRKVVGAGAATLAVGLALSACGGGESSAVAESCEGVEVNAGLTSSLSDATLRIADDRGYFTDEGLKVKFTSFQSGSKMVAPLGAGQLDVGAGAPSAGLYNAVARGIDLKIVADKGQLTEGHNYFPIMVRKELVDSGKVASIEDLKGLTVAESGQGSTAATAISAVLEQGGLKYDDVEHEYIGFPDMVAAFTNGSIDAAAVTEPTVTKLIGTGAAVRFGDSTKTYPNQQLAVLLYSGDFAADNKAAAQCFMNGYVRAANDFRTAVESGEWDGPGADEIVTLLSEELGLSEADIRKTVPGFIDPKVRVNVDSLQQDYDFFKDAGWLEGKTDTNINSIVDNSFVDGVPSGKESSGKAAK